MTWSRSRTGTPATTSSPRASPCAWTRGGEKQVASIRAARDSRAIHDHEEAVALKDALESNKVKLAVKAGAEGRLFGSVKTEHVADAVKAAGLGDLDKRKIHITSPIKSVGEHEATVRLRDDLTAVITLQVVAAK